MKLRYEIVMQTQRRIHTYTTEYYETAKTLLRIEFHDIISNGRVDSYFLIKKMRVASFDLNVPCL